MFVLTRRIIHIDVLEMRFERFEPGGWASGEGPEGNSGCQVQRTHTHSGGILLPLWRSVWGRKDAQGVLGIRWGEIFSMCFL